MEMSARLPDSSDHGAWKRRIGDSGTKWREVRERKRKGGWRRGSGSGKRGGHRHGPELNNALTHTHTQLDQASKAPSGSSYGGRGALLPCKIFAAAIGHSGLLLYNYLNAFNFKCYLNQSCSGSTLHKGLVTLKASMRPWLLNPNFPSNPFWVDGRILPYINPTSFSCLQSKWLRMSSQQEPSNLEMIRIWKKNVKVGRGKWPWYLVIGMSW